MRRFSQLLTLVHIRPTSQIPNLTLFPLEFKPSSIKYKSSAPSSKPSTLEEDGEINLLPLSQAVVEPDVLRGLASLGSMLTVSAQLMGYWSNSLPSSQFKLIYKWKMPGKL